MATAQQYYQQANQLAAAGQNAPPPTSDWKPLGGFGLVQPSDTSATQIFATIAAFVGFFTTAIPLWLIALVWVWSFFWMQVTEAFKMLVFTIMGHVGEPYKKRARLAAQPQTA